MIDLPREPSQPPKDTALGNTNTAALSRYVIEGFRCDASRSIASRFELRLHGTPTTARDASDGFGSASQP
jgi:hypothetical protein